jgi:hypothetical protein
MTTHQGVGVSICVRVFLIIASLTFAGCGSSEYKTTTPPIEHPTISNMTGNWELIFHSQTSNIFALESNLTQTDTHVFAGNPSALIFQATSSPLQLNGITVVRQGGQCDSGTVGDVTVDATISNVTASGETVTLTISQQGTLGTATITATGPTDGQSILTGTYSIPASCGFPADNGTFTGYRDSPHFGGDSYAGTLNSGNDAVLVRITSTDIGFDITAVGTDNGAPLNATGSFVGLSAELDGTISGNDFHWFLLYDSTYNEFAVFDATDNFIGRLHSHM